jgi:hypothetical protein
VICSARASDVCRDGYDVDTKYLSGREYPMWLNVYGDTNLIYNIKYWANEQRPTIGLTVYKENNRYHPCI